MGLKISFEDYILDLKEYIEEGKELLLYTNYDKLTKDDDSWLTNVSHFLKQAFENGDANNEFNTAGRNMFIMGYGDDKLGDHKKVLQKKLDVLIALEKNSKYLKPNIKLHTDDNIDQKCNNKIFIVHGRNELFKNQVARFLEKQNLEAIILHEQSNGGKTIIEKFEKNSDVGFAVVILSADDEGKLKGDKDLKLRARQNVVLELGYFIGKLGRDRVCLLQEPGVESPSDILSVVYEELDQHGKWQLGLAKELTAAGYKLDLNKLLN